MFKYPHLQSGRSCTIRVAGSRLSCDQARQTHTDRVAAHKAEGFPIQTRGCNIVDECVTSDYFTKFGGSPLDL
jgi:hypothetical protein